MKFMRLDLQFLYLMEGYVEKNNLVSLRGTLVPATTINKTISKIPFWEIF